MAYEFAFAVTDGKYETILDADFTKFISETLDDEKIECPSAQDEEKRWLQTGHSSPISPRVDVDEARVECLMDSFRALVANRDVVEHTYALQSVIPPPEVDYDQLADLPRLVDPDAQRAVQESLPLAAQVIPDLTPVIVVNLAIVIPRMTIMLMSAVVAYHKNALFESSLTMGYRGTMGQSCPTVEKNPCGHPLCSGKDGECSLYSFLKGCKCDPCNLPKDYKGPLFCEENNCGGRNEEGSCKGRKGDGQYKGCPCVNPTVRIHRYADESFEALQELVEQGPWTPESPKPSEPPKPTTVVSKNCYTGEQPKYVHWVQMDRKITEFCDQAANEYGEGQFWSKQTYNEGTAEDIEFHAEYNSDSPLPADEIEDHCNKNLREIMNGCDVDETFKYGGSLSYSEDNKEIYEYSVAGRHTRPDPIPDKKAGCSLWYEVWRNEVNVYGALWAGQDYGQDYLLGELHKCGALTGWEFGYYNEPNEKGYEWYAHFYFPIGHYFWECTRKAMVNAGAPDNFKCAGW